MALPVYDPDRHHIGLGASPEALRGFTLAGGARAMLQNAPQVTEFGSSRNLVDAPSLSRWTQDDFLGGAFWPSWHNNDPTVWSSSKNYIPSQQGRSLRSTPPFFLWDDESGGTTPGNYIGAISSGEYVITAWQNKLVRTKLTDKTRTEYAVPGSPVGQSFLWLGIDSIGPSGYPVLMVSRGGTHTSPIFSRYRLDTWAAESDYNFNAVNPTIGHAYAFEMDGIVPLMVILGSVSAPTQRNNVYSFSGTQAGGGTAMLVGRLPGNWVDSVVYNGLVYILCYEPYTGATRIVTSDGGTLSVLMDMPYNFVGQSITSYAGSIWICGYGSDVNDVAVYGELHQITGNTSRLVKTFSPENQVASMAYVDVLRIARTMGVWEGLLWIGGDHDRLLAYDITTDALYGAAEYSNGTGVTQIRQLVSGKGDLFGYCSNTTEPARTGWYRVARAGDGVVSYTPEFTTSDFDPEPALDKRWAEVHILSRYDDSDPVVAVSTDGGTTWVPVTSTVVTSGTFKRTVAKLSDAPVSRQIRLRYRFPRADNVTNYQELLAYTVTFSFLDSGKRSWVMPVLGIDRPELEDFSYPELDLSTLETELWSWIEGQTKLNFVDLDGQEHDVQLVNLSKTYTEVGPQVDGSFREGFYHLTLVEV